MSEICKCANWARGDLFYTRHHPNCPEYKVPETMIYEVTDGVAADWVIAKDLEQAIEIARRDGCLSTTADGEFQAHAIAFPHALNLKIDGDGLPNVAAEYAADPSPRLVMSSEY